MHKNVRCIRVCIEILNFSLSFIFFSGSSMLRALFISSPEQCDQQKMDADSESSASQYGLNIRKGDGNSEEGRSFLRLRTVASQPTGLSDVSVSRGMRSGRKSCNDHVPLFPNTHEPSNIVLEPYPNRRIRSVCAARGMLVTAHRNGLRIYRQRYLKSTDTCVGGVSSGAFGGRAGGGATLKDLRTGIWESVDFRDNFHLQDAYLCTSADCVFRRNRVLPLKWNRYVAAACGCDRTRYSVCVLSTGAHFLLHHELHSNNRIMALNFALVAMEAALDCKRYQPFVVSIDEIGEIVLFDVERDCAIRLTTCCSAADNSFEVTAPNLQSKGEMSRGTRDTSQSNTSGDVGEEILRALGDGSFQESPYRFEVGVASNVCLVGPCQVLCKQCGNHYSSTPGVLLLSLYVSSHAHGEADQMELQVHHLRLVYNCVSRRATVLSETPIIRESAPKHVCDIGSALVSLPPAPGMSTSVLIGRPRLRFWRLSGCAGKLLQAHRVYRDRDGSGKGVRAHQEYFVRVVPLGRHVLQFDLATSWLCTAALTENDVVLLLGEDPEPVKSVSAKEGFKEEIEDKEVLMSPEERDLLNAWLDQVEQPAEVAKVESTKPPDRERDQQHHAKENSRESVTSLKTPLLSITDSSPCFTVLMVLANPAGDGATPVKRDNEDSRSRQLLWMALSNELLFHRGDKEMIYSIKLPFLWLAEPARLRDNNQRVDPSSFKTLNYESPGWLDSALSSGYLFNLNIARPLMTAVYTLAGESELDEPALPIVDHRSRHDETEGFDLEATKDEGELSVRSPSVVTVDIDTNGSAITRRRRRRKITRSGGSVASMSHCGVEGTLTRVGFENDYDDNTRRAYLEGERQKFLVAYGEAEQNGFSSPVCSMDSVIQAEQLVLADEPQQRNAIMYEWGDIHDQLYIKFMAEVSSLGGNADAGPSHSGPNEQHILAGKPYWFSARMLQHRSIIKDIDNCTHSAGFMRVFRKLFNGRRHTRESAGVFDLSSFFSTKVVPQELLDIQDKDRCDFEMADLQATFERDMKGLVAEDTVTIFENEELMEVGGRGRYRWMSHKTFPFDDERGGVVDIAVLNANAALGSEERWKWADEGEELTLPRHVGFKLAHKRLQQWTIGEWMYALRWPSKAEEQQGTFDWSSNNASGIAKVRRRRLTRKRVNVVIEAEREKRTQRHLKEMEELRKDLGL
uniref:WGS project CAEQ00000000 data, annotated contig 1417 n=1 Tax=Trypanosoma congolense (strain IL3000) TaxID=1068625 RepID=F9W627_TRYCI|nr:unnamed protein product [Trypanosoma congolense IL3000]